jgi:N-methylhydantoinase B
VRLSPRGRAAAVVLFKQFGVLLLGGAVVTTRTGGGGGFGEPFKRPVEKVRQDIIDGFVTLDGAKADYGVVFNDDLSVDEAATATLRNGS